MAAASGPELPVDDGSVSGHGSWTEALLPGPRIGFRYPDDPNYVHERILGWPVSDTAWLILTPHDQKDIEDFSDWPVSFPLTGHHGYGDKVGDGDEVIAFDAPLEDGALVEFVVRARRLARIAQRDEPGVYKRRVLEPSYYVD